MKEPTPGIVYVGSVPPRMTLSTLRHLLGEYGDLERVYLRPLATSESIGKPKKEKKISLRTQFAEGWIEFRDKRVAKSVARSLNGTTIGGKKRSLFYECFWNLKYLPKFKWENLVETNRFLQQSKRAKTKLMDEQTLRENEFFLKQVSAEHREKARRTKNKKREIEDDAQRAEDESRKKKRTYKQREPSAA